MFENARTWRVVGGGVAAGIAAVVGFAGSTAGADPTAPQPTPAPVTVTQTVTVAPSATPSPSVPATDSPTAAPATSAAATTSAAPATSAAPTTVTAAPAETPVTATPTPVLVPAASGTLTDFFRDKGVALEAQNPRTFTALKITLPMPGGWTQVPDPNVPDAFAVIADRAGGDGLYTSNAQVVIYRLIGDFDPAEAITHGFVDSQTLPNWQSTDGSLAYFGGFPSSVIEGTYRQNDMVLNTSRRHVIASTGPDKYLVTLSVTTAANQAVAAAAATDAIITGFRVTAPAAATPNPAPAPAGATPSPVPAPAGTAAPAPTAAPAAPLTAAIAPANRFG